MNPKPLRILLFAHSSTLNHGGGRSLLELLEELCGSGNVKITIVLPESGPLEEVAIEQGIRTFNLEKLLPELNPYSLWWCGPSYLRFDGFNAARGRGVVCVDQLVEVIGSHFDVVYTNTVVCPLGALFAARVGLPHVWHLREFVDQDFRWTYFLGKADTYALIEALSDEVIVNSKALAAAISPFMRAKPITIIANGPLSGVWLEEAPSVDCLPNSVLKLALVGFIDEHKGQLDALESLPRIQSNGIACELHLFGDSARDYRKRLLGRARTLRLNNAVKFRGATKYPREAFCECHIALVCSRYEAFGRVTVEAMATERPVVASNSGATPEIIDDGETGLLYQVGDSNGLADCVIRLWKDRDFSRGVGRRAREMALARYARNQYGELVERVLRRAASRKNGEVESKRLRGTIDFISGGICAFINHGSTVARLDAIDRSWLGGLKRVLRRVMRAIRSLV